MKEQFRITWQAVEKSQPSVTAITQHIAKPSLFLTESFFDCLQATDRDECKWELAVS
jgi:hypothetical protein